MSQNGKRRVGMDMTTGDPIRLLVVFALPLLLGAVFQLMYSMVDTIVLGRFVSTDALAAVGASGSTYGLIMMLGYAMDSALTVLISQAWGAKNHERVRHLAGQSVSICLISGVVIGVGSYCLAEPLMRLLKTPENIIDGAVLYLRITCGIYIANMAYNTAADVLRAIGDSRTPLAFLIFCSVLNVILDLLFVRLFDNGIAAVAYATVLSQAVSAALCWGYMMKKYEALRFRPADLRPDAAEICPFLKLSLPMIFQHVVLCVGEMTITATLNACGSVAVAAYTVGGRVERIATVVVEQVDSSFSVYSGQNYGAKAYDRIELGLKKALLLLGGMTLLSMAVLFLFARPLTLLFVAAAETEVVRLASVMMYIEASFLLALSFILLYNAALRGIGLVVPILISAMTELACKIGLSLTLSRLYGPVGIWFASPIGWVVGLGVSAAFYYFSGWKKKALARDKALCA